MEADRSKRKDDFFGLYIQSVMKDRARWRLDQAADQEAATT